MSLRLIKHQCVGQASFEALLVISLGLSLLVSIQVVGNLRSVTLDLLAESRFLSSLPEAERFTARSSERSSVKWALIQAGCYAPPHTLTLQRLWFFKHRQTAFSSH